MSKKSPSYIFKSKHGVYYFQLRVSHQLQQQLGIRGTIYRKSLQTKDRKTALMLARKLWLDINYSYYIEYIMTKKMPSKREQQQILNNTNHELEIIASAVEIDKQYNTYVKSNKARAESFIQNLNHSDDFAMQYVSKHNIDLSEYYEQEPAINHTITPTILNNSLSHNLTLREVYQEFLNYKKTHDLKAGTFKAYDEQIGLFIEALKNKNASLVTKVDINNFKHILEKLPKNRKKTPPYNKMSFDKIITLELEHHLLLSQSSKSDYITGVKAFVSWAILNDYMPEGLNNLLAGLYRKRKQNHYATFTENDLVKLFNNETYQYNKHRYPWQYWLPLLALFTGARQNELCQLYVADIKSCDDVHYIDINDNDNKTLKNDNSKRLIPLHGQLIKLGFIKFVEKQKKAHHTQLFDGLKQVEGKSNRSVSRWFNDSYKKKCAIDLSNGQRKTYHSFRRTCNNALKQNGVPEEICAEILGHKQSITFDTYSDPLNIKAKNDHIQKLKYSIDFSRIRPWRDKR